MATLTRNQAGGTKIWLLVLSGLLLATAYGLLQLSRSTEYQLFGKLINRVSSEQKIVALTFDDGPTHLGTTPTLKLLNQHNIKGTFFVTGRGAKAKPEIVMQLIGHGHELGNHSYSHQRMVFMGHAEIEREIDSTNKLIRKLGYEGNIHFRPPFGKKLWMLPRYLEKNGITTIMWDVAPEQYSAIKDSPNVIAERALKSVKPGSIIILHPKYGNGASIAALSEIITELKKRGYSFKTVSELIAISEKSASKV